MDDTTRVQRTVVRELVQSIDILVDQAVEVLDLDDRRLVYELRGRLLDVLDRAPLDGR